MGLLHVTTRGAHTKHTEAASVSYFQALTLGLLMDTMNFLRDEPSYLLRVLTPISVSLGILVAPLLLGIL